jgi:hypothetical protein
LQHPSNRIVVPFKKPQLYLVAVYEIVNTEGGIINVMPIDMNIIKDQTDIWGKQLLNSRKYMRIGLIVLNLLKNMLV